MCYLLDRRTYFKSVLERKHAMAAGIFIVQPDGNSTYFPIHDGGGMIVTLSDFNDRQHLRFAMLPITSELPGLIKYDGRWYSNLASWNETLPDGEKPRNYYRQKADFEPSADIRTFEAESVTTSKPKGLKAILSAVSALWEELLLKDFYR
jgi:hypothetical protein